MDRKLISTISSCGALMTYGLSITIVGPILQSIEQTYGTTSSHIGLLFTFLSAGFLLSILLKSSLLRLVNVKTTALIAQLLIAVALTVFPFTANLLQGLIIFSFIGFAGGLIQVSANTGISLLYKEKRVSMLNVLHLFFGIGALIGPLLSGSLSNVKDNTEWGVVFWLVSGIAFLIFGLMLFSKYPAVQDIMQDKQSSVFRLLKDNYTWILFLSTLLYVGAEMGINSWSVLFLEKEHMLTRLMASSFLSYFWFFMTFGRVFGIYLSARFQVSTLLTFFSVLAFGGCGIFLYAPSGIGSGIGLAMIGFFFAGTYPFLIGLGGNHHPDSVEEITTILVGASALGFMIFPWLIGLIGEIGNLKTGILLIWLLCFLLTISSGLLMYLDRKSTSS